MVQQHHMGRRAVGSHVDLHPLGHDDAAGVRRRETATLTTSGVWRDWRASTRLRRRWTSSSSAATLSSRWAMSCISSSLAWRRAIKSRPSERVVTPKRQGRQHGGRGHDSQRPNDHWT